ncbi:ATP-binding protein [Nocardioides sp. NPDC000445]|uniref:ATP-binding protein n=1 Tax=Nocardioides sp. NPDC000445 TaxID=3154257 RepID=UPI00331BD652
MFVGRVRELAALDREFAAVTRGRRLDRGVAVLIRGRRRVGKSRLAAEFVARQRVPYVHFQAARGASLAQELATLHEAIAASNLPMADLARGMSAQSLTTALQQLATLLPDDRPSVVILDEIPWLLESTPGGGGELQRAWDLYLSRKPVLLLLLGSDLGMMERLTGPEEPFHGRATEMVLHSLSPSDVAEMTGTHGTDAFDAHLVTGGQPLVAQEWEPGMSLDDFLADSFSHSTSALLVHGSRILDSEFGEGSAARQVLRAIGGQGERTFSSIQRGILGPTAVSGTLTRTLALLADKRMTAADEPLSTKPAPKDRRYRIADPALKFWLAFVEPSLLDVDSGRPDVALARVRGGYSSWRGRVIEPVVRDAVFRLSREEWPEVRAVGGWWPRSNNPEIDLVGADTRPAHQIAFVGTVKWRTDKPLSERDRHQLARDSTAVPGADPRTDMVGVCPAGAEPEAAFTKVWTADDLLDAWR